MSFAKDQSIDIFIRDIKVKGKSRKIIKYDRMHKLLFMYFTKYY